MAARPNALRTLEYGKRLVTNQIKRLEEMVKMTTTVLEDSKTLTGEDVAGYKACIATANKQLTQLRKLDEIALPVVAEAAPRKRGRPSKAELDTIAATHGKKGTAKVAAAIASTVKAAMARPSVVSQLVTPVDAPKKRGRPSKASIAAEAATLAATVPAPKKRGRPAKVKTDAAVAVTTAPAQTVDQGPPAKRRGRPPKDKSVVAAAPVAVVSTQADAPKRPGRKPKSATPAINVAPITEGEPVKRGPGRPKGSKNAAKLLNGQHTEIISVN